MSTALLLDVHVICWPVITLLFCSFTVAVSVSGTPTVATAVAGVSVTVPTAGAGELVVAAVAVVVPLAMFDIEPNTAFELSVPRYVTSSEL